MDKILLSVKDLTVKKGDHIIIDKVSFELSEGETLAIIGPNGAGKTTLFRSILGLNNYEGTIIWKKNIKIGYVPQRFYIDYDLPITTQEFFSLKSANSEDLHSALEAVGLIGPNKSIAHIKKHIINNRLGNLSGGELQRVIIAWSLLANPDVLLFDEPTAGVDVVGEETIYSTLEKLKQKRNLTIILISHELEIVRKFTTQVLCLNKEKVCWGHPNLVLNEKTIDKLFGEEVHYYHHKHKH